jgi:hypothetical protein
MRSSTVQQAQQATMSVMLLPAMALQFGLLFVLKSESAKAWLESTLGALSFAQLISIIVGILAVLVAALLSLALSRFRRSQLILN